MVSSTNQIPKIQQCNLTCWPLAQDASCPILYSAVGCGAQSQVKAGPLWQSNEVAGVVWFGRRSPGCLPVGVDWQMGKIVNPVWRIPAVWWMEVWPEHIWMQGINLVWQRRGRSLILPAIVDLGPAFNLVQVFLCDTANCFPTTTYITLRQHLLLSLS